MVGGRESYEARCRHCHKVPRKDEDQTRLLPAGAPVHRCSTSRLTGNIAAGKSTVAELFQRWGATVIDADRLVREAQAPGSRVLRAIVERFGEHMLRPDGALDRAALRRHGPGGRRRAARTSTASCTPRCTRRRAELLARGAAARRPDRGERHPPALRGHRPGASSTSWCWWTRPRRCGCARLMAAARAHAGRGASA